MPPCWCERPCSYPKIKSKNLAEKRGFFVLSNQKLFENNPNKKITYLYNAQGVKISKKVYNNSTTPTETDYLGGFQYKKEPNQAVQLQFCPTAEGYVNNTVVNGINQYSYVYNYTDHLGNIRLSYKKNGTTLQILEENNYYPFGLKHTYYNTTNAQPNYKYKYNSKEYQDELGLNTYDYGGRIYDPAVPHFWQIDPMTDYREWLSPYNYVQNNPVIRIDPDGMLDDIVINGTNGSSVTIQTSLVDIEVNAGSLVGDLGGNYTLAGDDIVVAGLDIVGIFDPTGVADIAAASIEFKNGNFWSGLASSAGVVPLLGDLGKTGKIPKHIKTIENAIDAVKSADKATDLAKAEARAAKLSEKARPGMPMTKAGKESVNDVNKAKNNGKTVCETCGTSTTPAKQSKKGVTPPKTETNVDHVIPKSKGGSGTPDNAQILCRECNLKKGNKTEGS